MQYEWDNAKAAENLRKHGVDFADAIAALEDANRLEEIDPFTAETAEAVLRQVAEESGVKAGLLINGSRTMLTGQAVGPSMFEVFDILGQKRSVERLRSGVPWA